MRGGAKTVRAVNYALVVPAVFLVSSLLFTHPCQAITASYGQPYQGHLEDGVVFPSQFQGYHLRDENRSYTTPEVVGALLDALEAVRTQFPDTCDLFFGDFTLQNGGSAAHHRSHQNGRDVDIGMYARGNRPLTTFVPMSEGNLDAPKTWCLIENLIASQRVQYIFLDRSVQKVLYEYASSRGYDQAYLDRVFGNVRGALIQHIRNHVDHMHVRFFTPWSTLAAHIGHDETDKASVIEMAQQSYLPRKVNYYVTGSEKGLGELAGSFGVTAEDLCRWNHINQSSVLVPGSCLVFYKRSFESEPVLLARSLQPGFIAQAPAVRMASLNPEPQSSSVSDSTFSEDAEPVVKEKTTEHPATSGRTYLTCKARRGDTLDRIAHRNRLDITLLCQLNGIKKSAPLKSGQTVRTAISKAYASTEDIATDAPDTASSSTSIGFASDPHRPDSPAVAYYTVNRSGTLKDVSQKTGIALSSLCQLNGLSRDANLKSGQKIKLTQDNPKVSAERHKRSSSPSSSICFDSVSKKADSPTAAYYTVNHSATLKDVSKKTGIALSSLCQLNGLSRNANLKSGQRIKLTQASFPVKPSLGAAACSLKGSVKKSVADKPGKSDKKSSKSADGRTSRKPLAKSESSNSPATEKSKSGRSAKLASGRQTAKETSKSGKEAIAQRKSPAVKSAVSKVKARTEAQPANRTKLAKK